MISLTLASIFCAVFAWVFVDVLTDEGMILHWYYALINKLPIWLNKPLGGCIYCFGGQVALWYYLWAYWMSYDLITHIIFISGTIFILRLLTKLIYGN